MSRNDPRPWSVLSSSYLSRKPWLTLRQDRVRLPNGTIIEDYNVLEYPDWVNIVAITPEGMAVLVRQYRHGIRAVHYELPAGVCEASDPGPEETARRELLEETGYGGGDWSLLMTLSANPGTHSNRTFTYLANGVVPLQEVVGAPIPDPRLAPGTPFPPHLATYGEGRRLDEVLSETAKSGGGDY